MPTLIANSPKSDEYMSSSLIEPVAVVGLGGGSDVRERDVQRFDAALAQVQDTLLDWLRDPATIADDDTDPPASEAVKKALACTRRIRDQAVQYSVMHSPIPEVRGITIGTDGEVNLEFMIGPEGYTISFSPEGQIEVLIFSSDNRLVYRDSPSV